MQCFILAGGFATRLWPLTERRAKPLLPLGNRPILSDLVERIPADIPITVSTNDVFAEDFRRWAEEYHGRALTITIEDTGHDDHKLGSLGATATWVREQKIEDDILLLAGDNYLGLNLREFLKLLRGNPLIAAYDIRDVEKAKRFGVIVTDAVSRGRDRILQRIIAFEEKPSHPHSTLVSTGCWVLPKDALPTLLSYAQDHPDNVGGLFEEFLRCQRTMDCFTFTEPWIDIGSFEAYLQAHRLLLKDTQQVHRTAKVDTTTTLRGSVAIGPQAAIVRSALTDCVVIGQCTIDNCILERCVIDEGCDLRGVDLVGKMLRAGTVLRQ